MLAAETRLLEVPEATEHTTDAMDAGPFPDERLELVFTCCHPALSVEAQVALTLRTLGGLTTTEIARAFLVPEATMAQRPMRAKRKIAVAEVEGPAAGLALLDRLAPDDYRYLHSTRGELLRRLERPARPTGARWP